jgi:hypothetical protein
MQLNGNRYSSPDGAKRSPSENTGPDLKFPQHSIPDRPRCRQIAQIQGTEALRRIAAPSVLSFSLDVLSMDEDTLFAPPQKASLQLGRLSWQN